VFDILSALKAGFSLATSISVSFTLRVTWFAKRLVITKSLISIRPRGTRPAPPV